MLSPGAGAEGLRREERTGREDRDRIQGGFAVLLRLHAGVLRHGGAGRCIPKSPARTWCCRRSRAQLPPWLGALALAAVFSAEVSTCDAILFMLSTSMSKDLYKRFLNPAADDRQRALVARRPRSSAAPRDRARDPAPDRSSRALGIFYSLLGVSLFVPVIARPGGRKGGPVRKRSPPIAAGIATLLPSPSDRRAGLRPAEPEPARARGGRGGHSSWSWWPGGRRQGEQMRTTRRICST